MGIQLFECVPWFFIVKFKAIQSKTLFVHTALPPSRKDIMKRTDIWVPILQVGIFSF